MIYVEFSDGVIVSKWRHGTVSDVFASWCSIFMCIPAWRTWYRSV